MDIIYGTLLGDAYIPPLDVRGKNHKLRYTHSKKQQDWAFYKAMRINKPFTVYQRDRYDKRTGNTYGSIEILHNANSHFNDIYHTFYPNGKKVVTQDILNVLTPEAIAVWYCDDGSLYANKKRYLCHLTLATNSFTDSERELIKEYFNSNYGLNFKSTSQGVIRLTNKSQVELFMSHFAEYVPECMSYKLFQTVYDTICET
jgi:recombination protein RecA